MSASTPKPAVTTAKMRSGAMFALICSGWVRTSIRGRSLSTDWTAERIAPTTLPGSPLVPHRKGHAVADVFLLPIKNIKSWGRVVSKVRILGVRTDADDLVPVFLFGLEGFADRGYP